MQRYDRFSGKGPEVMVDSLGIPVSRPTRGGAPPRRSRPPGDHLVVERGRQEAARNRVADKVAKKTEQWAKYYDPWGVFSEEYARDDFAERALKAARDAAYGVYLDADHYPAGQTASLESREADRKVYGKARQAAKEAYEGVLRDESRYAREASEVDAAEAADIAAEYQKMQEDPWGDADNECWCESNFLANDLGMSRSELRQTCDKHRR
ncbi:hypothetical protein [Streptomyces venetus]|uniref:hypothetical protein n=1 Tax=Streptomyces venetus TaxID=1701086 RepID=UPI0031E9E35D